MPDWEIFLIRPNELRNPDERELLPTEKRLCGEVSVPHRYQAGFLKPILAICEIRVVGLIPKSSAAPSVPFIFHPVFCRTIRRLSRLRSRSSASVRYPDRTCGGWVELSASIAGRDLPGGTLKSKSPP